MTIPGVVAEAAQRYGDQPAVVDGDTRYSYAQLADEVFNTARAFVAAGVEHGDRVAVWAPNRVEFVLSALGAETVGAALVPLNTRYRGHEAAAILSRARATALVVANGFLDNDFTGMLRAAVADGATPDESGPVPGLAHLHTVVDMAAEHSGGAILAWRDFLDRGAEVSDEVVRERSAAVTPEDICDVLFTSGTTGLPKGVLTAHRQTVDVARVWGERAGLSTADNYAIVNPFFHGFGYKAGMVTSIIHGTTIYPLAVFDAARLLGLIDSARITVLPGAPTIFTTLLNHPALGDYDTTSLRFSVAGAASVPASLFRRMVDELGFTEVTQAYGLTEALVVSMSRPGEDPEHIAETTGPAVEGMELGIADTQGNRLPAGSEGEILVRGRNVMLGYFEDEEATKHAVDAGGWLHTGDVGRLDEHGCLAITDRLKDMFTVGGFNVYPAEVENVLAGHNGVAESAVVAGPDERMGSVAIAFVVPRGEAAIDEETLIGYCRERLANFKVPRHIAVRAELPKNAAGKVLKTELRPAAGRA